MLIGMAQLAVWDERAAIREYCGNQDRDHAEKAAWVDEVGDGYPFPDPQSMAKMIQECRLWQDKPQQGLLFEPLGQGAYGLTRKPFGR